MGLRLQHDNTDAPVGKDHWRARKRTLHAALFLSIVCGVAAPVAGLDTDRYTDIAATLRALEVLKFEAQQHKNISGLDSMLDNGLMWVTPAGELLTKAAYLASLQGPGVTELRISLEPMSIRIFDGLAIIVGIYSETGMKAGHPYHQRCRFIDTWAFKNGKWVCIAATATSTIA